MISVFDIFKVCIEPSSSHTVGPMKASLFFIQKNEELNKLNSINRIKIDLYGSLALTKTGHGTDIAIQLGLSGFDPKTINPNKIDEIIRNIKTSRKIKLSSNKSINFNSNKDIVMHKNKELPYHPNGMIITSYDSSSKVLYSEEYYSVGGGFVEIKSELDSKNNNNIKSVKFPNKFNNWNDLTDFCKRKNKEIWEIVLENELVIRDKRKVDKKIAELYSVMVGCIKNGLKRKGDLSGGLGLKRRSTKLMKSIKRKKNDDLNVIDFLLLSGMAASEENASYGIIISAPTNGAAGIIPAVVYYYRRFCDSNFEGFKKFILTAGAVGILCKINASISGAEGGCQAEVGSATAMAAAGLCAALGGTIKQCENAAIIGMAHNLGLTCDPVKGLVQVPCIERNAINAIKAVSACRLALLEKESVYLRFDQVVRSMKEVGDNMSSLYKETALGGLAKNAKKSKICDKNCKGCSF